MSDGRKYYVLCDANCKFEGMTKEQILTAIAQAVENGTVGDIDTGFVTTVKTITGAPLKFFAGTQYEYEQLTDEQRQNLFAIITNDVTKEGISEMLSEHSETLSELSEKTAAQENWRDSVMDGSTAVKNAEVATTAATADAAIYLNGKLLFETANGAQTGTMTEAAPDGAMLELLVNLGRRNFYAHIHVTNGTALCGEAFCCDAYGCLCADVTINGKNFSLGNVYDFNGEKPQFTPKVYSIRRIR